MGPRGIRRGNGEGSTMRNFVGHVARIEEGRSAFKIVTGKPTGERPLGRPRRRWESPCECGIEPPGSISHGDSKLIFCTRLCL